MLATTNEGVVIGHSTIGLNDYTVQRVLTKHIKKTKWMIPAPKGEEEADVEEMKAIAVIICYSRHNLSSHLKVDCTESYIEAAAHWLKNDKDTLLNYLHGRTN